MRSNPQGKRSVGGYFTALGLIRSKTANIKISLFIMLFFMIAGLAGLYFSERLASVRRVAKEIKIDSDASLVLNSMQHTSTKNGVKEWTLEATSAKVLKNEAKAILMDISILFFLKNGGQVDVNATRGYINTKESNIDLFDNVVVKYGGSIMKTDQLHYDRKSHIIYSNAHVTVTNKNSVLKSDTMKIDLNNNTLALKGNVYAILSDSLDFSQ